MRALGPSPWFQRRMLFIFHSPRAYTVFAYRAKVISTADAFNVVQVVTMKEGQSWPY